MSTLSQFKLGNGYPLSTTGIGYGTGSGGSVTQATSGTTAVTLNKISGEIIMNSTVVNNNSASSFTLNNSLIAAGDTILISAIDTNSGASNLMSASAVVAVAGGSALIKLLSSSSSWFPYLKLYFVVIKGATA